MSKENTEIESIQDLKGRDIVDQWDELIFETWNNTLYDITKYNNMEFTDFKRVIYSYEDNKMIRGKVPNGFDWTTDFVMPMYQEFIELVRYYFILFYFLLLNWILTVTFFCSY